MQNLLKVCSKAMVAMFLLSATTAKADDGKTLFEKHCASCHTIGGGESGGPDLKGVIAKRSHEWLESVIIEPDKLTAKKDPVQLELVKKYGYEMPNLGIGHEDALTIINYIANAEGGVPQAVPAAEQMTFAVTPELVAQGKGLFIGSIKMAKGGAACISCHPFSYPGISGGNLSIADLKKSYEKLGDTGMSGALKGLKFPTMKKIYADRPLTDNEVAALMALFKDSAAQKGGDSPISLPVTGGILFMLIIVGLSLYKRRIG